MNLNETDKNNLKELQTTLIRINRGERFFFNITRLEKMGLIKLVDRYFTNAYGNKERLRTDFYLTDKGKRIIEVMI